MPATDFTELEAAAIVHLAQQAPLQNMKHASEVSDLLQRFTKFVDKALKPAPIARQSRVHKSHGSADVASPDVLA